jgi:hypothetical protein
MDGQARGGVADVLICSCLHAVRSREQADHLPASWNDRDIESGAVGFAAFLTSFDHNLPK